MRAPASGAETQGETTRLDSEPMTATLTCLPPPVREPSESTADCQLAGNLNSYRPNMDRESAAKTSANPTSTGGDCKAACTLRLAPKRPTNVPMMAYVTAIPST